MGRDAETLIIAPGDYRCTWDIPHTAGTAGKSLHGECELRGLLPPRGAADGDAPLVPVMTPGVWFPDNMSFDRLTARLQTNHDLVGIECTFDEWFPGRAFVFPRAALVGVGIRDVPGDRYEKLAMQVTGLDMLFGRAPLNSYTFPKPDAAKHLKGQFTAAGDPGSTHEWVRDGVTLSCHYDGRMSMDGYQFTVVFRPVVTIESDTPRTLDEWISEFVVPLWHLTTFATRQEQHLTYVVLSTKPDDDKRDGVRAQVFGSGITQVPYDAERPDAVQWHERPPLFTLAGEQIDLPALLVQWRALRDSDNPFAELYGTLLFQPDLPARARYLYLVQALEGLHGFEHQDEDEAGQEQFAKQRLEKSSARCRVRCPRPQPSSSRNTGVGADQTPSIAG